MFVFERVQARYVCVCGIFVCVVYVSLYCNVRVFEICMHDARTYVCACMYVCFCVCACAHMHVCIYTHACTYVYVKLIHTCLRMLCMFACTHTHAHNHF